MRVYAAPRIETPRLWTPQLPLSTPEGRVLRIATVRDRHPCQTGYNAFLRTVRPGADGAVVNPEWARRMAEAPSASGGDALWAAAGFLPRGWTDAFHTARRAVWDRVPEREQSNEAWARVSWAVFAALYVEAGKP